MPHFSQTHTFGQAAREFEQALAWMAAHNAPLDGNRVARYRTLLAHLVEAQSADDVERLKRQADDFLDVLFEVEELLEIHRGFKDRTVRGLEARLRRLVEGPIMRKDERPTSASIIGRNTALELILASRLSLAGLRVDLNHDEDVRGHYRWHRIHFECKRPSSPRQILPKLKDAVDQCNTRIARFPLKLSSGMVLVDFSWVANPKAVLIRRRNAQEIAASLSGAVDTFAREFVPQLKLDQEPRLLGVMVRFAGLIVDNEINRPYYAQQWGFVVNSNLKGYRISLANSVAHAMNNAVAKALSGAQQGVPSDRPRPAGSAGG